MGVNYVISKLGTLLTEQIGNAIKKQFDISEEQIGMGVPGESNHLAVCIYLYDMRRCVGMQSQQMVSVDATTLRYPSNYYDIYYMIIPNSQSDLRYRMEEEAKLAEVLLQTLCDIPYLGEPKIGFYMEEIELDEKVKIWNGLNQPYRLAFYCKAGPVEIQSNRTKEVKRVREIHMDFMQNKEE